MRRARAGSLAAMSLALALGACGDEAGHDDTRAGDSASGDGDVAHEVTPPDDTSADAPDDAETSVAIDTADSTAASDALDALDASTPPDGEGDGDDAAEPDAVDAAEPDAVDAAEPDAVDAAEPDAVDAAEPDAVDAAEPDAVDTTPWRSALYPEDWTAGFADGEARLQDYSYAGYHGSALALGAAVGVLATFDVGDFGALAADPAAPAAAADATGAFQAAIDAAEVAGGRVYVPPGLYRLDGLLTVGASRVVIAGDGPDVSRLWFTRAGLEFTAHLTFQGREDIAAESALVADGAAFDTTLAVADASAFAVGDDVLVGQIITPAFVAEHGMNGIWQAFNDTWQAFYRRDVVAVDTTSSPHTITLDVPLRDALGVAHGASVRKVDGLLREVGLEHIGVANASAWADAWTSNQLAAVTFERVADAWVDDVASFTSPGAPTDGMGAGAHLQANGLMIALAKRVTVADVHLGFAQNRGSGGNGYLFEVRQASEVLTRDASATKGRHNFIQNWGFGTTGCVWLRCTSSEGGQVPLGPGFDTEVRAASEYHHSLATANLVDQSRFDDGFEADDRGAFSSGAGITARECVFWNFAGSYVVSRQFALGYVIGTAPGVRVSTALDTAAAERSAPEDFVEGCDRGPFLEPPSLYEDQLARRRGR